MQAYETFVFTDYSVFDSTALRRAWYNKDTNRLVVQFRERDNYAGYNDVSPDEWQALKTAQSVGAFYAYSIKPRKSGFSTPDEILFERHFDRPVQNVKNKETTTFKVTARVSAETSVDIAAGNIQEAIDAFTKRLVEGLGESVEIDIKGVVRN